MGTGLRKWHWLLSLYCQSSFFPSAFKLLLGGPTKGWLLLVPCPMLLSGSRRQFVEPQSTWIPRVPQCLSPRRKRVCPPPPHEPKGGGHARLRGRGVGECQFRRLEKGLALCLPCEWNLHMYHCVDRNINIFLNEWSIPKQTFFDFDNRTKPAYLRQITCLQVPNAEKNIQHWPEIGWQKVDGLLLYADYHRQGQGQTIQPHRVEQGL